jgi:hypothetical protein
MSKHPVLKKVDINELMDTMMELWTRGVDYVDIVIKPEENSIALMFTEEYLSEEAKEKLLEMENDDEDSLSPDEYIEVKSKLTDDDLNQLM